MGIIAKGEVTLSSVNDAYTVSLSPATCAINADFNGDNPHLENARGQFFVKRGAVDVPFSATVYAYSDPGVEATVTGDRFKIDRIPNTIESGWVDFHIEVSDGYTTVCRLTFSVVRESTMLDWIQDWENNKTKIGDSYIMTPKMFIGRKDGVSEVVDGQVVWKPGALTGVYLGPDILGSGDYSTGIYGYKQGSEIFHLNADGGMIGGWTIANGGIQTSDGTLSILSEGTIISQEGSTTHWSLGADGSGIFANGNVIFQPDGTASFNGSITATDGEIGGWTIVPEGLYNGPVLIDSSNRYIGIAANQNWNNDNQATTAVTHRASVESMGGVAMYWQTANDYGMVIHSATGKIAQFGSANLIAGWTVTPHRLSNGSVFIDSKEHIIGIYTGTTPGSATDLKTLIQNDGLMIYATSETDYGLAYCKDNKRYFSIGSTNQIAGWEITPDRLSTAHIAFISSNATSGIYITTQDISETPLISIPGTITANGGISLGVTGSQVAFSARDTSGKLTFLLQSNGTNSIGPWTFTSNSLYIGSATTIESRGYIYSCIDESFILSTEGLIGRTWCLLKDGSGSIANGNITWDADGSLSFSSSVSLSWGNISGALGNRLTQIDSNGVYTGSVSANKITAGTIVGSTIKQAAVKAAWQLNSNGSGFLANRNIRWDTLGNTTLEGGVSAKSLTLGDGSAIVVLDSEEKLIELPKLSGTSMRALEVWVIGRGKLYFKVTEADQDNILIGEDIPFHGAGDIKWLLKGGMYRVVGVNIIDDEEDVTYWNIIRYNKAYDLDPDYSPTPCGRIPGNLPSNTLPFYNTVSSNP